MNDQLISDYLYIVLHPRTVSQDKYRLEIISKSSYEDIFEKLMLMLDNDKTMALYKIYNMINGLHSTSEFIDNKSDSIYIKALRKTLLKKHPTPLQEALFTKNKLLNTSYVIPDKYYMKNLIIYDESPINIGLSESEFEKRNNVILAKRNNKFYVFHKVESGGSGYLIYHDNVIIAKFKNITDLVLYFTPLIDSKIYKLIYLILLSIILIITVYWYCNMDISSSNKLYHTKSTLNTNNI